jgi:hypothetical protein
MSSSANGKRPDTLNQHLNPRGSGGGGGEGQNH